MRTPSRRAILIHEDGKTSFPLDTAIVIAGRGSECDFVVDSRKVSRRHCCMIFINDHLAIRDLGSTNGCRIAGERVDEFVVKIGETFAIADVSFRLAWEDIAETVDTQLPQPAGKSKRVSDSELEQCDEPIVIEDEGKEVPTKPPPGPGDTNESLTCLPGLA